PTNGRDCFRDALAAIRPQVDQVFVVYNGQGESYLGEILDSIDTWVIDEWINVPTWEINISKWWNLALNQIALSASKRKPYDVAIINDDAIVPEHWVGAVCERMRALG